MVESRVLLSLGRSLGGHGDDVDDADDVCEELKLK